jgi:hypothetical protein
MISYLEHSIVFKAKVECHVRMLNKQLSNSEYSLSCLHQVKSHLDEILVTVEYDSTTKREIMGIILCMLN